MPFFSALKKTFLSFTEADPAPILDAYKDSYITKAAARTFLQKMKNYRDTHTNAEYQHFVDEIAFRPVKSSEETSHDEKDTNIVYDKKYFDYLPTDDSPNGGGKQQSAGGNLIEYVDDDDAPAAVPQQQRENHRRLKRQAVDCK